MTRPSPEPHELASSASYLNYLDRTHEPLSTKTILAITAAVLLSVGGLIDFIQASAKADAVCPEIHTTQCDPFPHLLSIRAGTWVVDQFK